MTLINPLARISGYRYPTAADYIMGVFGMAPRKSQSPASAPLFFTEKWLLWQNIWQGSSVKPEPELRRSPAKQALKRKISPKLTQRYNNNQQTRPKTNSTKKKTNNSSRSDWDIDTNCTSTTPKLNSTKEEKREPPSTPNHHTAPPPLDD